MVSANTSVTNPNRKMRAYPNIDESPPRYDKIYNKNAKIEPVTQGLPTTDVKQYLGMRKAGISSKKIPSMIATLVKSPKRQKSPKRIKSNTRKSVSKKRVNEALEQVAELERKLEKRTRFDEEPAFFNIFVESRHADRLENKDIDEESRMEVIYRILKDELRKTKKKLLEAKKEKENKRRRALDLKMRVK